MGFEGFQMSKNRHDLFKVSRDPPKFVMLFPHVVQARLDRQLNARILTPDNLQDLPGHPFDSFHGQGIRGYVDHGRRQVGAGQGDDLRKILPQKRLPPMERKMRSISWRSSSSCALAGSFR